MNVLGLDLGTNSVGWALIENDRDKLTGIIAAGSRIVPLEPDLKSNFENGKAVSKTGDRRESRSARRVNQRFKMRRKNLMQALLAMGILPEVPDLENSPQSLDTLLLDGSTSSLDLYELRSRAVTEKVSLAELGRILLHMNQRRGYAPTRSEQRKNAKGADTTYGFFTITSVSPTGVLLKNKPELKIALSNGTVGHSVDAQFTHLVNQRCSVQIVQSTNKKGETSVKLSLIDTTDDSWDSRIGAMESELQSQGETPGQYFFRMMKAAEEVGEAFRVRQNLVLRRQYLDEFEKIWDQQATHHPVLMDEAVLAKVVEAVTPRHYPLKKAWSRKSLREFFRDYIIYFQRPLRSQKGSISNCTFETAFPKKVIPKSHPRFQEFKLWNQVNNLVIEPEGKPKYFPSVSEKEHLFQELQKKVRLSPAVVAKICHCNKDEVTMSAYLDGDSTTVILRDRAKKAGIAWAHLQPKVETIWHILYSLENEDEEVIQKALHEQAGISLDQTEFFMDVFFLRDYGNLSAKAIGRLLPLMRAGTYFEEDALPEPVRARIEKLISGEEDDQISPALRNRFADMGKLSDFSGLQFWEAASLVYGDHSQVVNLNSYTHWSEIEPLKLYSLRNPVVEQVVNETLQVIKAVWKQYGKPDRIHLEMSREMRQNAKQRDRRSKQMRSLEKERDEARKELQDNFARPQPSRKDIEKYLLWKEAGFKCVYSGIPIPRTALFNGETDIDHILPQSRYFDDSFLNKVLTFKSINKDEKKNLTAFEYKQNNGWESFQSRVLNSKALHPKKKQFLLMEEIPDGFSNRQGRDTSYIAKRIRVELEKICPAEITDEGKKSPRILLTSGAITNYLKGIWKLNRVFKKLMLPRYERFSEICQEDLIDYVQRSHGEELKLKGYSKRIDHRHHALDAIVIATTRQRDIQVLNQLNKYYSQKETGERSARRIKLPHPQFRDWVQRTLSEIVVSHKSRNHLLTWKHSHYHKRNAQGVLTKVRSAKPSMGVRGELHEATVYGKVKQYHTLDIRKAFSQVEQLVVDWQRDKVKVRLEAHHNDVKAAIKSLKKNPLADLKGETLDKVTVLEEHTTQVINLERLSPALLNKGIFLDRKLGKEIRAHVARFPDLKTAISPEGLLAFNQDRKIKVHKVKMRVGDKPFALQPDRANPRFVNSGENFGTRVIEDEHGKRTTEVISFYDAVQYAKEGIPLVQPKPGHKGFLLQKGHTVYVLKPDEKPSQVDWNDAAGISDRLYVCKKMSGAQFYFLPHTVATVFTTKDGFPKGEYGSTNRTEFHDGDHPRTKIIEHCIRVHVDHLGNVTPLAPKP